MASWVRKACWMSLMWMATILGVSGTSSACCLDWLCCKSWRREAVPPPAVVYPPTTAQYAPQTYQPAIVNYAPQTVYRTQWYRVPVTNYRPVSTVDPATGFPVTTMSPCVNYTWQARRVPLNVCRPIYSTIATQPSVSLAPVVTTNDQPQLLAPTTGCQGCPASPSVSAPYYTTPPTTTSPSIGTATPASPQPLITSPEAADVQPRLRPQMDKVDMPEATSPAAPQNNFGTSVLNGTQSSSLRTPIRIEKRPLTSPAKKPTLRPVPDPDRLDRSAPALLDPMDKTARRLPVGPRPFVLISWPEETQQDKKLISREQPSEKPATEAWDSSGWQAVTY